jgi:hypothetical protein
MTPNQLAVHLLSLTQQEKQIKQQIAEAKTALEALYAASKIPAKNDVPALFSDGSTRKVRLQRVPTGTYFKVGDDHKEEFNAEAHKLQSKYIKAGKAEMAEKAPTWKVQEVKG